MLHMRENDEYLQVYCASDFKHKPQEIQKFKKCKHGNVGERQCGVATMFGHSM